MNSQNNPSDDSESTLLVTPEAQSDTQPVNYLFIAGCPRSGTTAMLALLNADERVVLGRERFKFKYNQINPSFFTEDRFFNPVQEETNYADAGFYGTLLERWRAGGVLFMGDKYPIYYRNMPYLQREFPGCKYIFTMRDLFSVASSYNVRAQNPEDRQWSEKMDYRMALEQWTDSLVRLRNYIEKYSPQDVFIAHYERFFAGDTDYLDKLYDFLQMPITDRVRKKFLELTANWDERRSKPIQLTSEMISYLNSNRDYALEVWCLQRCPRI